MEVNKKIYQLPIFAQEIYFKLRIRVLGKQTIVSKGKYLSDLLIWPCKINLVMYVLIVYVVMVSMIISQTILVKLFIIGSKLYKYFYANI